MTTVTLTPVIKGWGSLLGHEDKMIGVYQFTKGSRRKQIDCFSLSGKNVISGLTLGVDKTLMNVDSSVLDGLKWNSAVIEITMSLTAEQLDLVRLVQAVESREGTEAVEFYAEAIHGHMVRSNIPIKFGDQTAKMLIVRNLVEEVNEGLLKKVNEAIKRAFP